MRVGQNPAKSIESVPQPERVTIAVVSYIPFLSGYYAESLEILKTCLESIWNNTRLPYDLLVFDNASCVEVRSYLNEQHTQGRIQYLVLSDRNVGKGGAWNFIFQAAPGEVIAYADSDVEFLAGWLEHSLAILDGLPQVGMVSARPLRTPEKYFTATLDWARSEPAARLEKGQFTSWEVFQEHTDSMGIALETAREWFTGSYDWRLEYGEVCAYVGAAHFQFIARKDVLQTLLPFKMDRPMGQVRSLDEQLNAKGFLRLATQEALARHLGNRLPAQGRAVRPAVTVPASAPVRRLFNLPVVRRVLLRLYDAIFRLYFDR